VTILADVLDVAGLFSQPFMRYALLAGTAIALASGLVGYFVVLRGQVFTGDALSHAAFAGALAALAAGIDLRVGLFAGVVGVAIVLGVLGDRGRADDVAVGAVFAWVLGLGVLFLSLFTTNKSSGNGAAGVNVLFGSIFGFDSGSAWLVASTSTVIVAALVGIVRPLLFASIEPLVAEAAGVPVRVLSFVFLVLVAVTAGMASQAVGALLLLALLAAPAAAAQRLAIRPYAAMGLSAGIAIASMWIGLAVSYRMRDVPPSFSITATLTACYTGAVLWSRLIMRGDDRRPTG
jgi:zinc/manganese transport system permease protein